MDILEDIGIINKALWLKKLKTLIIADLHVGYEEALNKQGILVPRTLFKETVRDLEDIFKQVKPETIVINGDLKHEFGVISDQEWKETLNVFDLLKKNCRKIVLVRGNHDTVLGKIAKKRGLDIVESYCIDGIYILHGDKELKELKDKNLVVKESALPIKILIIGHEHAAISLQEGPKTEKYKCFLLGTFKKQKLIVMPSFLPIIEGTDVRKEKLLSPYLQQKLDNFEVFVVGDKTYRFGKLKDIE